MPLLSTRQKRPTSAKASQLRPRTSSGYGPGLRQQVSSTTTCSPREPLVNHREPVWTPVGSNTKRQGNLWETQRQTSKIEELKLSPFLTLKKDFAFLLPTKINVGDLIDVVKSVDPVIGDVTVFDIYEDPKFDSRGLSIGIEVEIKQNEKVLNAKEINEYMTKIIEDVKSKLGANLRN